MPGIEAPILPILIYSDKSRSGKDSVATQITKYFELQPKVGEMLVHSRVLKISKPVKKLAYDLFGFIGMRPAHVYETSPIFRQMKLPAVAPLKDAVDVWVKLGELLREVHPDCLIHKAYQEMCLFPTQLAEKDFIVGRSETWVGKPVQCFVIPDWRMDNELKYLEKRTCKPFTIKVNGSDSRTVTKGLDGQLQFDDFDVVVDNTGTPDELKAIVYNYVLPIIKKRVQALALEQS